MSDDAFGFQAAKKTTSEKLKAIKPSSAQSPTPEMHVIDAVGEAHGFHSREEAQTRTVRRKGSVGPTIALNTRAPERVALPFVRFCEENRFSYWEGIEELMKRSGLV